MIFRASYLVSSGGKIQGLFTEYMTGRNLDKLGDENLGVCEIAC